VELLPSFIELFQAINNPTKTASQYQPRKVATIVAGCLYIILKLGNQAYQER
jgi:hypothetical protein